MMKLAVFASVAALSLGVQTAAHAYSATASVTVEIGGTPTGTSGWIRSTFDASSTYTAGLGGAGEDHGWSSDGTNDLTALTNATYFTTLSGYSERNYYNPDFVPSTAACAPGAGIVPSTGSGPFARKYGCRYSNSTAAPSFNSSAVADVGPNAKAIGTLTVTDTTLMGTLTLISTTNEPTGGTATTVGNGTNGYNYRTADGSPFGNAWYGLTTAGTYQLSATGTFTSTAWTIDHATALFFDSGYACQQGGYSVNPPNLLCSTSTVTGFNNVAGGHQANGQHLSWGWDVTGVGAGTAITELVFTTPSGTDVNLSGLIAVLAIIGSGTITTTSGEFRRGYAASSNGTICPGNASLGIASGAKMAWNGARVSCGTLTTGRVNITGVVTETSGAVPIPAAAWLFGSAFGALGWLRRKAAGVCQVSGLVVGDSLE